MSTMTTSQTLQEILAQAKQAETMQDSRKALKKFFATAPFARFTKLDLRRRELEFKIKYDKQELQKFLDEMLDWIKQLVPSEYLSIRSSDEHGSISINYRWFKASYNVFTTLIRWYAARLRVDASPDAFLVQINIETLGTIFWDFVDYHM